MTDAEKEYRAQWIRDAARDFLVSSFTTEQAHTPIIYGHGDIPPSPEGMRAGYVTWATSIASALWDLYVKERE